MSESWLNEIDLRPKGLPIQIGIRKLGDKPWLLEDNQKEYELSLKAQFTKDPNKQVFL